MWSLIRGWSLIANVYQDRFHCIAEVTHQVCLCFRSLVTNYSQRIIRRQNKKPLFVLSLASRASCTEGTRAAQFENGKRFESTEILNLKMDKS
jgi:hypothetical protein